MINGLWKTILIISVLSLLSFLMQNNGKGQRIYKKVSKYLTLLCVSV